MNATPQWLTDMGEAGGVPLMHARGAKEGSVCFMTPDKASAAVAAGSHVSLEGKDMTTFDLATERKLQKSALNRAMSTDKAPRQVPDADKAEGETKRTSRVGRYANRAMVTKPGEGN